MLLSRAMPVVMPEQNFWKCTPIRSMARLLRQYGQRIPVTVGP